MLDAVFKASCEAASELWAAKSACSIERATTARSSATPEACETSDTVDPSATTFAESTAIPEFYQPRITATARTFTDPAFVFGGGVSLFASRRISIRPDVETMLVRRNGQNYVVTTFAARFAYHFEDRPITPAVRFQ